MRIEMATAACLGTQTIGEFDDPVCVIYGRSNSDRAAHGKAARREDIHLIIWVVRYTLSLSTSLTTILKLCRQQVWAQIARRIRPDSRPQEEWRTRGNTAIP